MGKTRANSTKSNGRDMRPALDPEARENQLISRAIDLAERQLIEGTASSQVITHYLKMGSTKEKLELERLRNENELLRAKTKALQEASDIKALYENAMEAMKKYSSSGDSDD